MPLYNPHNVTTGMDTVVNAGNLVANTAGKGVRIAEGGNAKMGYGTLVAGTLTVATTAVEANSRIFLCPVGGTLTNVGALYVSAKTTGTSFVVTSTNAADTCLFNWLIVDRAP